MHYDQDQTVKILIYCPIDQNGTHLPGNGSDHHYYLAYATKHPGSFYLVNTVEEATSFEGYRFQ